jgi:hypothetical protein
MMSVSNKQLPEIDQSEESKRHIANKKFEAKHSLKY